MSMRIVAVGIVCVGVMSAVSAMGEDEAGKAGPEKKGPPNPAEMFKKMDTDSNGIISLAEFKVAHEARQAKMKEKMGEKFDASKAPSAEDVFAKMDADKSGGVTKEEMDAAHKEMRKGHGKGKGEGHGKGKGEGKGAAACPVAGAAKTE